jgi:hypothetical protein
MVGDGDVAVLNGAEGKRWTSKHGSQRQRERRREAASKRIESASDVCARLRSAGLADFELYEAITTESILNKER